MSYSVSKNFLLEIQEGKIDHYDMIHKFGRNDSVPSNSWEFVNLLGFTNWPLIDATTVRIKAGGDAADSPNGNGAKSITVQGIDFYGYEVKEVIATNGASVSLDTVTLFRRIHRAWANTVGVYGGANTGDIIIENSSGGTDLIKIAANEGQTQFAGYTIPINKTGYFLSLNLIVDASKAADFRMFTRENIMNTADDISPKRLKLYLDGVLGHTDYYPKGPGTKVPSLTDIWIEAQGGGAGTEVSADFELLLVDIQN